MKMSKCFTMVFDNYMKPRGFSRKGILYYRMIGNMLQGVRLETVNPYFITFSTFPYWLYHKRTSPKEPNIARGNWVQSGGSLEISKYYSADAEDQSLKDMGTVLDLVRAVVIPYLDRVSNEAEYLQMVYHNPVELLASPSLGKSVALMKESPTAEFFLYNQYYGDEPISAKEAVQNWYRNKWAYYLSFFASKNRTDERYIQDEHARIVRWRDSLLKQVEQLEQNGFAAVYEAMCVDMKQQLSEQLKIRFEN